jgi:hypothetical protein
MNAPMPSAAAQAEALAITAAALTEDAFAAPFAAPVAADVDPSPPPVRVAPEDGNRPLMLLALPRHKAVRAARTSA